MAAEHDADDLSARELEVARLVADGRSNPAIAAELFVSVATVKTHVSHILGKLGLESASRSPAGSPSTTPRAVDHRIIPHGSATWPIAGAGDRGPSASQRRIRQRT